MSVDAALAKLRRHEDLSGGETQSAFDDIFVGSVDETTLGEFLLALRDKGETTPEILGAVASMRAKAITINAPANTIDIVGTGGDGHNTLNISTAAALIVASCGVPVAKHGNRAASSKSGSSDVLAALGINLEPDFRLLEECLAKANLCFLFAPRHHPAMRHVIGARKKLGVRTIFNLLGPLTNPANVTRHVIGVYDKKWMHPVADVLQSLGSEALWVTHGRDGMDELTIEADSDIVALEKNQIKEFSVSPGDIGIAAPAPLAIRGGDAAYNAAALTALLDGKKDSYRDIVALNAAAGLIVGGAARDLKQGFAMACEHLDNGAARDILRKLVEITNRDNP